MLAHLDWSAMLAPDNVIWTALTTRQSRFAQVSGLARRFPEEVSVLGAVGEHSDAAYSSLARLTGEKPVGLFLPSDQPPKGWSVISIVRLMQMSCENGCTLPSTPTDEPGWVELSAADSPEMVKLAELTRPGPFGRRTRELGRYIGIRQESKLVAMAGERLCVPGFTEVSAVCTHPDYAGRGYARRLMSELMQRIVERDERPFLHVRNENTRAIELYRQLGFRESAQLYYAVVRCDQAPA